MFNSSKFDSDVVSAPISWYGDSLCSNPDISQMASTLVLSVGSGGLSLNLEVLHEESEIWEKKN